MNRTMPPLMLAAAGLLLSTATPAAPVERYYDSARVVKVTPLYKRVEISRPKEYCWKERVEYREPERDSPVGAITGAIIGGVVGNQFGRGRGRDLMTAAGAVLGGAIGHDASRHRYYRHERRLARHCETQDEVAYEERLTGYRVKYRYKGHVFVTRMKHRPGRRLRIEVALRPVAQVRDRWRRHERPLEQWDD